MTGDKVQGSSQKWSLPSGVRRTPTHICIKVSGRSERKPNERLKMRFPTCWATVCMFVRMIYSCTPCFRGNKVHDTLQTTKRPWTPPLLFCHNLPPPSLNLQSRPFGVFYISLIFVHLLQMVINPPILLPPSPRAVVFSCLVFKVGMRSSGPRQAASFSTFKSSNSGLSAAVFVSFWKKSNYPLID